MERSLESHGRIPPAKDLYLADRNILVDQPKDGIFAAFGDARCKIGSGEIVQSREMYFAIYQALAEDERRIGLFKSFPPEFFDLVIVDECHRGSARDDNAWRIILDHFALAVQLGMTATPLRADNRDTYLYFGNPIYEYSLRQGIDDGFLAPYHVHRVVTEWDATGWRPSKDDLDRYGRATAPRRGKCSTISWRNTLSTETRNSCCPTYSACRRFRGMASPARSFGFSEVRSDCARPCRTCRICSTAPSVQSTS